MNTTEHPPLPMTRSQARSAGLKVFTTGIRCSRSGHGVEKLVSSGRCAACTVAEKERIKAAMDKARESIKATARAALLREQASQAKAAQRAHERALKAAERMAATEARRKARTAANAKATREARKLALSAVPGGPVEHGTEHPRTHPL